MSMDYQKSRLRARSIALFIVLFGFIATPVLSEPSDLEFDGLLLPHDAQPAAEVSSPFAGTWIGLWDGVLKTILIVESVSENGEAKVIYSIADNPRAGFKRAWFRLSAMVTDDNMVVEGPGFELSLKTSSTGRLRAIFGDGLSFAVLSRRELASLGEPDAPIEWSFGTSEMIRTGLVENGEPIDLETVMFSPEGMGPFPLAVVNHGSTGRGTDSQAFLETWTSEWFADVLNENGFLVAFPQRRGRGQSDGLYDEGFSAKRALGYSCETELSLAGADRARDDLNAVIAALRRRTDTADGPVLLSGNSRGGILSASYAGLHPDQVLGVINFVGGWAGELCNTAETINGTLAHKAAGFDRPMLWLYGEDDPFYSIAHSRKNFELFKNAGGKADFHQITVRGNGNGHWVMAIPPLWSAPVESYLSGLGKVGN